MGIAIVFNRLHGIIQKQAMKTLSFCGHHGENKGKPFRIPFLSKAMFSTMHPIWGSSVDATPVTRSLPKLKNVEDILRGIMFPTIDGQRRNSLGYESVIESQDITCDTVDGRNPAPVDRWFIPLFIGFQPS